jgi:hypothetical protein
MTDADTRGMARARMRRLQMVVLKPIGRQSWRVLAAATVGAVIGVVAQFAFADWRAATLVNLVAAFVAIAIAVLPMRDRVLRDATEVYSDHMQTERAEWRLFTGTRMPMGFRRMEVWLLANPDSPYGRPAALTMVGRYEEAETELARHPPRTARETFEHALLREESRVLRGFAPDLPMLEALLPTLTADEQRHRRECLALLEAYRGMDEERATLPIIASGRDPRGLSKLPERWL